jgi:hypothetical protein
MRERHKRRVVFLEDGVTTAWADLTKRAVDPPPMLWDIVDDKCAEHTTDRVSKAIGVAWATTDKLRDEKKVTLAHLSTANVVWARRTALAHLDREADARYAAEDAAEAAERARADARRDVAEDARASGGHR